MRPDDVIVVVAERPHHPDCVEPPHADGSATGGRATLAEWGRGIARANGAAP